MRKLNNSKVKKRRITLQRKRRRRTKLKLANKPIELHIACLITNCDRQVFFDEKNTNYADSWRFFLYVKQECADYCRITLIAIQLLSSLKGIEGKMFCSQCGVELLPDSKFCNHCGAAQTLQLDKSPDSSVQGAVKSSSADSDLSASIAEIQSGKLESAAADLPVLLTPHKRGRIWHWLLPVCSLCLVAAAGYGLYMHQMKLNKQVDQFLAEGESLVRDGKLMEGKDKFEAALAWRPEHPVLLNNKELLRDAIALDDLLQATENAESDDFDQTLKTIRNVKRDLKARTGVVFDQLSALADQKEEDIVIKKVSESYPEKTSVRELSPLLRTLRAYKSEKSGQVMKLIEQKMVEIAHNQAADEADEKQFGLALATIDEVLGMVPISSQLEELRSDIEQRKTSFEQAEQQRIQQALETAAKEDEKNRTAAVEVLELEVYTDEYGYFNIEGSMRNNATRMISGVIVYVDILDSEGTIIDSEELYVHPDYIEAGGEGRFSSYLYNYGNMAKVRVTSSEWQLI
ncbi:zinc-ribbon domain-containing protein [Paenibacillaceae bacterium]|nr:zinc-ribbon domain-containing protein [Paenibacillaceae bacterium]